MKGFFGPLSITTKPRKNSKKVLGCEACGLYTKVISPRMPVTGEGRLNAFILGEAPGETEDRRNIQFVGESGGILRKNLRALGYDLDRDFFKSNALACRPTNEAGSNRTPTKQEIKCCEQVWREEISKIKPAFIILLGSVPVEAFFMNRSQPITTNLTIGRWRKLCIPDSETGAWIIPLFHPSYVLRNPDVEHVFNKDLSWALKQLDRPPFQFEAHEKNVHCLTRFEDVMSLLSLVFDNQHSIVIDYETSSIKPYFKGSNIWTIGLSIFDEKQLFSEIAHPAYSFPLSYPGAWTSHQKSQLESIWRKILEDANLRKIAQNVQMERSWSDVIFGVKSDGWTHDTMVCSHVLDERPNYTGLDFQVFINWGYEYGSDIAPFKKPVKGSLFNSMHQCPLGSLLLYNGLDVYFTDKLARKQFDEMNSDPETFTANHLFQQGVLCFSDMEMEGIRVDVDYYRKAQEILARRLDSITKRLMNSSEAKLFLEREGREIDPNSPDDLKKLFFKHLEIFPTKLTKLGNLSTDEEALDEIDNHFAKCIKLMRKISKLKSTYVDGILNGQIEGRLHPNFHLHFVRTYRSSSSDINFHNLPKRDQFSMEIIRGGIMPSCGNCLVEADYGGHEIRVVACYANDQQLIKDLKQDMDIHGEWGKFLDIPRFDAKNSFVFPEIYGSYYKSIFVDIRNRGFTNVTLQKVQRAEFEFWKRYKGLKKLQDHLLAQYNKNGYVQMFHGFRRRGFLTRNQMVNSPIQGTAFHLLLWSCIQVNKRIKQTGLRSQVIGQIHDSVVIDTYPTEVDEVVKLLKNIMVDEAMKEHRWIKVPLLAEVEISGVNEPWYRKKKQDLD